jgi:hypothetical protein
MLQPCAAEAGLKPNACTGEYEAAKRIGLRLAKFETRCGGPYTLTGGERGPVTFPVFKAGDSVLRGSNGGFDFHTPPPLLHDAERIFKGKGKRSFPATPADCNACCTRSRPGCLIPCKIDSSVPVA